MKYSVFIATSADGMIARKDGSVDWLHSAGNSKADMREHADMGFKDFIASVDCMIMGRKCMEVVSKMNLTTEQWPYGSLHIIVLSNTLKYLPENMKNKVHLYSGNIIELVERLSNEGFKHVYVDGGQTIQTFLTLKLINEITITKAPILLGEGIPLFGNMDSEIRLSVLENKTFPNDFLQVKYKVNYH